MQSKKISPTKQGADQEASQLHEVTTENINEFIVAMEEHRATCEAEGRYVEAELAKNRIAELKEQAFSSQMEELLYLHEQQRQECEQAHIKQYQEFNEHWDRELQQSQQEDSKEIQNLEEKHTQDIQVNRQTLEEKLSQQFKSSAELLNLRKIEANLARQKNYQQAHEIQVRANELESKEREQYMVEVSKKVLASESTLISRQQNEMAALRKKLEGRMNERLKLREVEHNKILQRYQNVKKEIENQQNIERNKKERAYQQNTKARPGTASGRSVMQSSKMGTSQLGKTKNNFRQSPASKPSNV